MEPFVLYQADRLTPEQWEEEAERYRVRLRGLFTDAPIPYRRQNGGHYDSRQVLKDGLGQGESGSRLHLLQPGEPAETPL